jgi:subtilisin family serine protease
MRTVPRRSSLALLVAAAALAAPAAASAAAEGGIIVKYAAGADAGDRADARADAGVVVAGALPLDRTQLVRPEAGTTVAEAVAGLERSPDVAYAEPDALRSGFAAPTDARFAEQWSLQNTGQKIFDGSPPSGWSVGVPGDDIDVVPAWEQGVTQSAVTVGVVDSGVDLEHPDLKASLVSGGHDFVDGDDVPADENGHGTHVAGIIGASGNNGVGVTGVAWRAGILPVRVLDQTGSGRVSAVVHGYDWAVSHGARIVNVSLGGGTPSQTEYDAIRNAADTLFVVAAGNDGADVDTTDSYPCAYDLPNIVCVAATGGDDRLASFSDYGARSVDLAAPGVDILSTYPTTPSSAASGSYAWMSGTSMAAPEVTGAAALVLDRDPDLTPWQVHEKLLGSVDKVAALDGKVASGGRLDVAAALAAPAPTDATPASSATAPSPRQAAATTPAAPATPAPATPQPVTAMPAAPTAPAAPAAPAPPAPAADRTAPDVGLSLAGRGALGALLKARLRVPTSVSERASIRIELRLDARTAKRLHLKATATGVRIATGTASATAAGTARIRLRPTRAAKRALARVRRLRVTLTATAADATGNRGTRSRALTITR